MNKFKKLLLTLAPLSAVAIATPIILTSCSTNNSNPNNPSNPGGGNGDINQNGDLTLDDTNKNEFIPTTDGGLFKKVEETVKAGKQGDEDNQVDTAFTAYNSPTEEDVKDAIKIWSFNKWFEATKIDGVEKYISNFVGGFDGIKVAKKTTFVTKEETKPKWDISFSYKFQIAVKSGDKTENILAERLFNVSNIELSSTVLFTTEAKQLIVDGKPIINPTTPTFYGTKESEQESDVVKKVKEFVSASTSSFDSKAIFKSFIKNKEIKGTQEEVMQKSGEWLDSIEKPDGVVVDATKKILTVDLSKIDPKNKWYNLDKDSTQASLRTAVHDSASKNITETFKKLIYGNADFKTITVDPATISKGIQFFITYDNKADEKLTLTFNNVKDIK